MMKKSVTDSNHSGILELTDSIIFAIRENNELQAMNDAEKIFDEGLPFFIDDHLQQWKYMLVRAHSLIMEITRRGANGSFITKTIEKYLDAYRLLTGKEL